MKEKNTFIEVLENWKEKYLEGSISLCANQKIQNSTYKTSSNFVFLFLFLKEMIFRRIEKRGEKNSLFKYNGYYTLEGQLAQR